MDSSDVTDLVIRLITTLIPLILAIAVHEWAHIAMARFLGDDLGTIKGRYTLNPLAHIDPVWTLLVPAILVFASWSSGSNLVPFFAAGKPAPYNPLRLDREFRGKRITLRTAELLVAAAGPTSNVVMAAATMLLLVVLTVTNVNLYGDGTQVLTAGMMLIQFFTLNIALAVFNLIPIPPLDGSKVLMSLLPRHHAARFEEVASKLSYFLLAFLFLGGARWVIYPVIRWGMLSLYWVLDLVR